MNKPLHCMAKRLRKVLIKGVSAQERASIQKRIGRSCTEWKIIVQLKMERWRLQKERILLKRVWEFEYIEHCLYQLAINCLQDRPERRPSTKELNSTLKRVSIEHSKVCLYVITLTHAEGFGVEVSLKHLFCHVIVIDPI